MSEKKIIDVMIPSYEEFITMPDEEVDGITMMLTTALGILLESEFKGMSEIDAWKMLKITAAEALVRRGYDVELKPVKTDVQ